MQISTVKNSILFTFDDETAGSQFNNVSEGGIIYKSFDHDTKTPRWGTVKVIGPDVKYVKVDDKILIEPLRWTEGFKINDLKLWKTIESEVMVVESSE